MCVLAEGNLKRQSCSDPISCANKDCLRTYSDDLYAQISIRRFVDIGYFDGILAERALVLRVLG